jgi:two-component system sensor histidine kinase KdpD
MLGEARGLKAAGVDVVIGYLEAHGRRATEDRAAGIEVAPRRVARRGDRTFTEMDTDWILERGPQLVLVDELAHTNHPGGRNAKRWQDVEELLDAGIDVDTTVNIQHLESLNDKVFEITGVRVRETFPDRLLQEAASAVVVDLPPEALRERIAQGRVYAPEKVPTALTNFFRVENLTALRALALREVAEQEEPTTRTAERVLVCIDGRPNSEGLVRRAAQIVLGESHRPRWRELLGQSIIANILRETDGIDIIIVADARARLEDTHADPGEEQ